LEKGGILHIEEDEMRYLKRLAVAAAALGLTAGAALARPAVSETDLNVRSGPGTGYRVVGVLQQGESVDVADCTGSWCRVSFAGGTGWASASYLAFGGDVGYAAPPPAMVYDDPFFYDDYYYAPGFAFIAPGFRHHHRHHRGHWGHRGRWAGGGSAWRGRSAITTPRFNRGSISRGNFSRGNVGIRGGGNVGMRSGSFRSGGGASFRSSGGGFRGGFSRGGGGGGGRRSSR
jgi:uncharacterized protein YraI